MMKIQIKIKKVKKKVRVQKMHKQNKKEMEVPKDNLIRRKHKRRSQNLMNKMKKAIMLVIGLWNKTSK